MSIRPATVWVIECDAPDCLNLAVPAGKDLRTTQQEKGRRALNLAVTRDAFITADSEGWTSQMRSLERRSYYCPDHADVPDRPQPIRQKSTRKLTVASKPARENTRRSVTDVPLPEPHPDV